MIICTKEVSVGARKNAYNLLVEIGNTFVRFCGNAKGNKLVFLILCKYIFIFDKKQQNELSFPLWSRCIGGVLGFAVCRTYRLRHHDHLHSVGTDATVV